MHFVEIDLRHLITHETLKTFNSELNERRQNRQIKRNKERKFNKKIEKNKPSFPDFYDPSQFIPLDNN